MQARTSNTKYPPLSLHILRKNPEDPFPLPNIVSKSILEKPSREVSPFPTEPPHGPTKNQYLRKIVQHTSSVKKGNPLARLIDGKMAALIVNKSQDNMMKALTGIQQVRTASEARIRKNIENLNEVEHESPEEIDWNEMIRTGKYIGFRESPKKDIRLSGIALKKEKNFQNIRKTMGELKYELQNKEKVVKFFTGKIVNPEELLRPQLTPFETKPLQHQQTVILKREEPERISDSGRVTPIELIEGIADLQMPTIETTANQPDLENKEFIISYNKQQLKKLRGSINHVQRVALKNRIKKAIKHEEIFGKDETTANEFGDLTLQLNSKSNLRPSFSLESPLKTGSESSRKKILSKKQFIEERIKNATPKDEFLKKLLTKAVSPTPDENSRASFFLTTADAGEVIQAIQNAERSKGATPVLGESFSKLKSISSTDNTVTSQFYLPQRFSAGNTSQQPISEVSSTHLIHQPRESTFSRYGYGKTSTPTILRNNPNNITTTERGNTKSPVPSNHGSGGKNRSYLIKSSMDKKRVGHRVEVANSQMQEKYKLLALECENNSRSSATIGGSLYRNFGEIKEHLKRMDEYVSNEGAEIDWQIKQDIFAELHNAQVALANKMIRK